jgi:exonuclease SbcC
MLQAASKETELSRQILEGEGHEASAREDLSQELERLREMKEVYEGEAARHDVLVGALARLAELVSHAECPLCGREFRSADQAKQVITEHIQALPALLKNAARRLEETKGKVRIAQARLEGMTKQLRDLKSGFEQSRSTKEAAVMVVQKFVEQCSALGVMIDQKDTPSWHQMLQRSADECGVDSLRAEVATLRERVAKLSRDAEVQQGKTDELRDLIGQLEKEGTRLTREREECAAEMRQRGFDPTSLPDDEHVTAELLRSETDLAQREAAVTAKKLELGALDNTIQGLRNRLRESDEAIAGKNNERQQYETACNRFVTACRSACVDPEAPSESIRTALKKATDLKNALGVLDGNRQVLQGVVGLKRLKKQIDVLSEQEASARQELATNQRENTRMGEWVSHLEVLEREVTKGQIGLVSSHLQRLEPTIQRLYHRLNPHPIFGRVRLRIDELQRQLDIEMEPLIAQTLLGDVAVSPSAFFSEAQMNALAISVFLAGALRQRWSGFRTILIDDPIQQMDEMNVCAFLDLVRGLSGQRQFIIFTCSRDFYLLALE